MFPASNLTASLLETKYTGKILYKQRMETKQGSHWNAVQILWMA
jgi:hypothetical protein